MMKIRAEIKNAADETVRIMYNDSYTKHIIDTEDLDDNTRRTYKTTLSPTEDLRKYLDAWVETYREGVVVLGDLDDVDRELELSDETVEVLDYLRSAGYDDDDKVRFVLAEQIRTEVYNIIFETATICALDNVRFSFKIEYNLEGISFCSRAILKTLSSIISSTLESSVGRYRVTHRTTDDDVIWYSLREECKGHTDIITINVENKDFYLYIEREYRVIKEAKL